MADAISKAVSAELLDLVSRETFAFRMMRNVANVVRRGDTFDIPQQSAPTDTSATTRAAPEALTPTVTTLSVDQEIFYNVNIPRLTGFQYLDGAWVSETARHALLHRGNGIDDNLFTYLIQNPAADVLATPAYHTNTAADSVTDDDVGTIEAMALDNDGTLRQNLAFFMNPWAMGSLKTVADYVPGFAGSERGQLGIPQVTSINGIPAYVTRAAPGGSGTGNQFSAAISASSITTNVLTVTVPSGHGFVDGQQVYTSGLTTDAGSESSAVTISSVTATTVVMPLTACDTGDNGTGTLYAASSYTLLIDLSKVFTAVQQFPDVEVVKDFESAASALQLYTAFGRAAPAGSVWVLHSPVASV